MKLFNYPSVDTWLHLMSLELNMEQLYKEHKGLAIHWANIYWVALLCSLDKAV